jgi:hypothetical protein
MWTVTVEPAGAFLHLFVLNRPRNVITLNHTQICVNPVYTMINKHKYKYVYSKIYNVGVL